MNRKELVSRWKQGQGAAAQTETVRGLQKQESIDRLSPFGTVSGRTDFRGFSAGSLRGIRAAQLTGIDLSYCDMKGVRMTDCSINDVEFTDSSFREFVDERNHFENCHFQRVSFRGSQLGTGRSEFTGCTFDRCDFSGLRFGQIEFNSCQFVSCRMKGVDFGASSFEEVEFIGKLEDVWFRGRDPFLEFTEGPTAQARTNDMKRVSFAQAELRAVTFSDGCNLSTVVLPDDGLHHHFDAWNDRLKSVMCAVDAWNNSEASNFVASFLPHAEKQAEYILNRNDVVAELGDETGAKMFDALLSASPQPGGM